MKRARVLGPVPFPILAPVAPGALVESPRSWVIPARHSVNSDANSTPRGRDLDDRHPRNSRGQWCEYINSRSVPFRFEVEQTRSRRGNLAVEGYVYNSLLWPVGRVRLRIDILDQNGMVIDTTYGWVGRDVPAGGRAYFVVPIAVEGAAYRVTVASFDTLGGGGA